MIWGSRGRVWNPGQGLGTGGPAARRGRCAAAAAPRPGDTQSPQSHHSVPRAPVMSLSPQSHRTHHSVPRAPAVSTEPPWGPQNPQAHCDVPEPPEPHDTLWCPLSPPNLLRCPQIPGSAAMSPDPPQCPQSPQTHCTVPRATSVSPEPLDQLQCPQTHCNVLKAPRPTAMSPDLLPCPHTHHGVPRAAVTEPLGHRNRCTSCLGERPGGMTTPLENILPLVRGGIRRFNSEFKAA